MTEHEIVTASIYIQASRLRNLLSVTSTAPRLDAILRLSSYLRVPLGPHATEAQDPDPATVRALNEVIRRYLDDAKLYPCDQSEQRDLRQAFAAGFWGQPLAVGGLELGPKDPPG